MKHLRSAKFLAMAFTVGLIASASTVHAAPCPPGFSSPTGEDPCTPCPPGFFSDAPSQTACQPCSLGTYQDSAAQTTCDDCSPGTYQGSTGSTACDGCAAGTYSTASGATSSATCEDCNVGTYAPGSASTTCDDCTAGRFADSPGATACQECSPGSSSDQGAQECTNCPRGTYAENPGSSSCDDCDAGTYSSVIGAASATTCQDCNPGSYGPSPGLSTCTQCQPGSYSNTSGTTVCLDCDPGQFGDSSGSTTCQDCAPETYADSSAATVCEDCPPLTYQPDSGQDFCYDRDSIRCWKAKDLKNPKFVQQEALPVADDFADDTVDLKKAALFCAPVAVGGQPVTDSDPRRCCYKAKGDKLDPAAEIEVAGSLGGTLQLSLKKASLLCDQCQGTPGADPLRCWKVKDLKNPKFVKQEAVSGGDELATDTFDTKKPDLYCAPASVNGGLVADPNSQLCCYKVKGSKLDPAAVRATSGDVGGSLELEMKKQSLVCEPCTKIDLP